MNVDDLRGQAERLRSEGFEFFLASNELIFPHINKSPLGIDLELVDVTKTAEKPWNVNHFLRLYNLFDGLAFGSRGMAMPHWVMVDLALLPSAIVIITTSLDHLMSIAEAKDCPRDLKRTIETMHGDVNSLEFDGPVPVAAYCGAATPVPGRWVGWSLFSVLPGFGLGVLAKQLAMAAYQVEFLDGVTQYDNSSLRIHTKFGPLRVRTAQLDVHTSLYSFVYEMNLGENAPNLGSPEPTFLLEAYDSTKQGEMQKAIENGDRAYYVLPPGLVERGTEQLVPIYETTPRSQE